MGNNPEVEQAYVEFLAKFGKQYASKDEIFRGYNNFAKNYELVRRHNSKESRLFDMELNHFSDLSPSDFLSIQTDEL